MIIMGARFPKNSSIFGWSNASSMGVIIQTSRSIIFYLAAVCTAAAMHMENLHKAWSMTHSNLPSLGSAAAAAVA